MIDLVRPIHVRDDRDDLQERALDAILGAEVGRFDPDLPEHPDLDARIIAAIRSAPSAQALDNSVDVTAGDLDGFHDQVGAATPTASKLDDNL